MQYIKIAVVIFLLGMLLSCSTRIPPGPETLTVSPEASRILSRIRDMNRDIRTFKGIGRIKFEGTNANRSARIAFIASIPRNLRVQVILPTGQPEISFTSSENLFCILSHSDKRYYRKHTDDPDLKKILSIPIKPREIISMFCGKTPIQPFFSAVTEPGPNGNLSTLVLQGQKGKTLQKIHMNQDKKRINEIEMFSKKGSLLYRVRFERFREVSGNEIPFQITVSNDRKVGFQMQTRRFWINMPVSESVFEIRRPS